ncbi:MAG: AtpZ/AtpI family protein [Candidatus Eisenbacteria bacterium]|nr:AtpZ/AtpI family protein [Candidatus Eisenbacteria bacterium]
MPDRRYSQLRQLGLLASIPALMVIAPLLGLFAGQWVEERFHLQPWGTIVGLALGFGAAVREIAGILRKVKDDDDDDRPGRPGPPGGDGSGGDDRGA